MTENSKGGKQPTVAWVKCPSYLGFDKCAPVDDCVRIFDPGNTNNKIKRVQPTQGTIFGAVDCFCVAVVQR